ncbi:MAG TPA: DMT family transporter [Polyangiaceae bacterium]
MSAAGGESAGRRALIGYALVAGAASSWGFWPWFLRHAEAYGPIDAALESTVALGILTIASGALMLRDRLPVKATKLAWAGVTWLGVGDALNDLFFFKAYQTTTVAVAVLTHYLTPILVAVAAPFLLREKSDPRTKIAVALSFGGLVLLLEPWQTVLARSLVLGAMFGAASAVFYASNVIVNKVLVPTFSGSEMSFWHGVVATPLVAAFVPAGAWSRLDPRALGWLFAGSCGPGALAGLCFVWGLRRIDATRASTLTLLEPLVATCIVGAIVFGERPGALALLGGVLILVGTAIALGRSGAGRERRAASV